MLGVGRSEQPTGGCPVNVCSWPIADVAEAMMCTATSKLTDCFVAGSALFDKALQFAQYSRIRRSEVEA